MEVLLTLVSQPPRKRKQTNNDVLAIESLPLALENGSSNDHSAAESAPCEGGGDGRGDEEKEKSEEEQGDKDAEESEEEQSDKDDSSDSEDGSSSARSSSESDGPGEKDAEKDDGENPPATCGATTGADWSKEDLLEEIVEPENDVYETEMAYKAEETENEKLKLANKRLEAENKTLKAELAKLQAK